MKKYPFTFLWLFLVLVPGRLPAQSPVDDALSAHKQRMEANRTVRDLERLKLRQTYKGALEQLLDAARAGGNLELFVATEGEIKRIETDMEVPEPLSSFPELARLQGILAQQLRRLDLEHAGRIVQLHRQLDGALSLHQQEWVRGGKIEEAKELDRQRKALMDGEEARWAVAILNQQDDAAKATGQGPRRRPTDIRQVQPFFKGRVSHYNPVNLEIEVTYDFSRPEQLADFKHIRGDLFQIEGGRLLVRVPPHSDWWVHAKMNGPSLYVPFLEAGNASIAVDLLELAGEGPYHLAVGISDLNTKTIGIGPLSTVQSHAVEGWTPASAELRDRGSMLPLGGVTRLTAVRTGDQVELLAATGRRSSKFTSPTAKELRYVGLYPKSWGAAPARVAYDNLVVKGTLSLDWMAEVIP